MCRILQHGQPIPGSSATRLRGSCITSLTLLYPHPVSLSHSLSQKIPTAQDQTIKPCSACWRSPLRSRELGQAETCLPAAECLQRAGPHCFPRRCQVGEGRLPAKTESRHSSIVPGSNRMTNRDPLVGPGDRNAGDILIINGVVISSPTASQPSLQPPQPSPDIPAVWLVFLCKVSPRASSSSSLLPASPPLHHGSFPRPVWDSLASSSSFSSSSIPVFPKPPRSFPAILIPCLSHQTIHPLS